MTRSDQERLADLATRVVREHPDRKLFLDKLSGQLPKATALLRELLS